MKCKYILAGRADNQLTRLGWRVNKHDRRLVCLFLLLLFFCLIEVAEVVAR